jgi:Ca2+-binding EF-hand superfamily protein
VERAVFNEFDIDGSGAISVIEFFKALVNLGMTPS